MKRVGKPNSVSPTSRSGDHSSSPTVTGGIKQPTRKCPLLRTLRRAAPCHFPIWPCTARSLPGRICHQTRRWALTPPFHPSPQASPRLVSSLLHLSSSRRIGTPGGYPARCPMVFGLSSPTEVAAIAQRASLQGFAILAKNVEQTKTKPSSSLLSRSYRPARAADRQTCRRGSCGDHTRLP